MFPGDKDIIVTITPRVKEKVIAMIIFLRYILGMTGTELQAALAHLGFSQRAFAAEITRRSSDGTQTTPATVNRWIKGVYPIPGAVAWLVETLLAQEKRAA